MIKKINPNIYKKNKKITTNINEKNIIHIWKKIVSQTLT